MYDNIFTELQTIKQQSTENTNTMKQMINDIDTKLIVESAKREKEIQSVKITKQEEINCKTNNIDIPMPIFSGEAKEHPKTFLKDLNSYLTHKNIRQTDRLIVIENCLKGTAAKWFTMIKDTMPTEEMFRTLFLKNFFSEDRQWDIFIKCTEAGKQPIKNNFQEHFHFWMAELKYLDSKNGRVTGNKFNHETLPHSSSSIHTNYTRKKIFEYLGKTGRVRNGTK